ncbi:hypothetical protein [Ruania albidiflava]|uniref:hypothetical protein n=1 Tax=Ruania albidiflava TaxID=366586 RepID=UPI0012FA3DC3|nr:hypothetical protein [Ruania albidiflava]
MTVRAGNDYRVHHARRSIAMAAGCVSGAVAGLLFDLIVPGPFTPSVTLFAVIFGAIVGCLAGLLSALLLNLVLSRTQRSLTRTSATLALTALGTVVVAVPTMLLSWNIGPAELLVALLALVAALPASAEVASSSATART